MRVSFLGVFRLLGTYIFSWYTYRLQWGSTVVFVSLALQTFEFLDVFKPYQPRFKMLFWFKCILTRKFCFLNLLMVAPKSGSFFSPSLLELFIKVPPELKKIRWWKGNVECGGNITLVTYKSLTRINRDRAGVVLGLWVVGCILAATLLTYSKSSCAPCHWIVVYSVVVVMDGGVQFVTVLFISS